MDLISITKLKKTYLIKEGLFSKEKELHAIDDLSLNIYQGETLGIVG